MVDGGLEPGGGDGEVPAFLYALVVAALVAGVLIVNTGWGLRNGFY